MAKVNPNMLHICWTLRATSKESEDQDTTHFCSHDTGFQSAMSVFFVIMIWIQNYIEIDYDDSKTPPGCICDGSVTVHQFNMTSIHQFSLCRNLMLGSSPQLSVLQKQRLERSVPGKERSDMARLQGPRGVDESYAMGYWFFTGLKKRDPGWLWKMMADDKRGENMSAMGWDVTEGML